MLAPWQGWSEQQLRQDLGFTKERANQLAQWAWGNCSAPVEERPPPKSLSVQMSLTPVPLAMHPSFQGRSVCDDDSTSGARMIHCSRSNAYSSSCPSLQHQEGGSMAGGHRCVVANKAMA